MQLPMCVCSLGQSSPWALWRMGIYVICVSAPIAAFDRVWQCGVMTRDAAYRWMADYFCIPLREAHIGTIQRVPLSAADPEMRGSAVEDRESQLKEVSKMNQIHDRLPERIGH